MKYLCVSHPDDEILFFNPEEYDKIIIVFTERLDKPGFDQARLRALEEHPLKDKIEIVGLTESNFWRDETKLQEYVGNYDDLQDWLIDHEFSDDDEITTHDAQGEYGHSDHKLIYTCLMDTVNCKVNGQNPVLYRQIKNVYIRHGVWTWILCEGIW